MRCNEQIEIRWQIRNPGQNYTHLFLKGRPGNNFVSFRPQVLREKSLWLMIQIVAFLPYCSFLYAIPDRPHENRIWTREVLQLKLSSNWPMIPPLTCSSGLFLLNSGYWNQYLSLGVFFCAPIWSGKVNFMWHVFANCGNPTRPHTGINPAANWQMAGEI